MHIMLILKTTGQLLFQSCDQSMDIILILKAKGCLSHWL